MASLLFFVGAELLSSIKIVKWGIRCILTVVFLVMYCRLLLRLMGIDKRNTIREITYSRGRLLKMKPLCIALGKSKADLSKSLYLIKRNSSNTSSLTRIDISRNNHGMTNNNNPVRTDVDMSRQSKNWTTNNNRQKHENMRFPNSIVSNYAAAYGSQVAAPAFPYDPHHQYQYPPVVTVPMGATDFTSTTPSTATPPQPSEEFTPTLMSALRELVTLINASNAQASSNNGEGCGNNNGTVPPTTPTTAVFPQQKRVSLPQTAVRQQRNDNQVAQMTREKQKTTTTTSSSNSNGVISRTPNGVGTTVTQQKSQSESSIYPSRSLLGQRRHRSRDAVRSDEFLRNHQGKQHQRQTLGNLTKISAVPNTDTDHRREFANWIRLTHTSPRNGEATNKLDPNVAQQQTHSATAQEESLGAKMRPNGHSGEGEKNSTNTDHANHLIAKKTASRRDKTNNKDSSEREISVTSGGQKGSGCSSASTTDEGIFRKKASTEATVPATEVEAGIRKKVAAEGEETHSDDPRTKYQNSVLNDQAVEEDEEEESQLLQYVVLFKFLMRELERQSRQPHVPLTTDASIPHKCQGSSLATLWGITVGDLFDKARDGNGVDHDQRKIDQIYTDANKEARAVLRGAIKFNRKEIPDAVCRILLDQDIPIAAQTARLLGTVYNESSQMEQAGVTVNQNTVQGFSSSSSAATSPQCITTVASASNPSHIYEHASTITTSSLNADAKVFCPGSPLHPDAPPFIPQCMQGFTAKKSRKSWKKS